MNNRVDVVVIGSGVAGLSAAVAAKQSGAESVMVCEAQAVLGGASRLSDGLLVAAGSRLQQLAGLEDSPEAMYYDYMNVNGWVMDAGIARRLAADSGPVVDWLEQVGVEFNPTIIKGGFESTPRCALVEGRGQGLIDGLAAAARELGVDFAMKTRVDDIRVSEGVVRAVRIDGEELDAGAVVVATGGIGSNKEMLAKHYPQVAQFTERQWYVGGESSQGDALRFAATAGAAIRGVGQGLSMLTPGFAGDNETYQPGWLVIVDPEGSRFMPEDLHYSALDRMAAAHGGGFWAIFDSAALDPERSAATPFYAGQRTGYPGREARRSPNWNPETLNLVHQQGRLIEAGTITELASRIDVPAARLAETVRAYNEGAAIGADRFGKAPEFLRPIDSPPYFAARLEHALVVITSTGLAIDPDARVQSLAGAPIGGLFAAGEAAGEVWGRFYPSSGSSLGSGAVMGRVAGTGAAGFATGASGS